MHQAQNPRLDHEQASADLETEPRNFEQEISWFADIVFGAISKDIANDTAGILRKLPESIAARMKGIEISRENVKAMTSTILDVFKEIMNEKYTAAIVVMGTSFRGREPGFWMQTLPRLKQAWREWTSESEGG
jgi:hypothetical protein